MRRKNLAALAIVVAAITGLGATAPAEAAELPQVGTTEPDGTVVLQWWGYEIHFTKAETKNANAQSGIVGAMSVLCGLVPGGPASVACFAAATLWGQVILGPLRDAAKHNNCVVLNQPYAPIPPWLTEVKC